MASLLTIGHSIHEPEDFVALLGSNGVELLVDVRRHPGSRRVTWTNAGNIENVLGAAGVGYLHLEALGGRRKPEPDSPNSGWRVGQFQGYADHMRSGEFRTGLDRLEQEAAERRAAVMCAEAQWWRCHRRLIADAMTVREWEVLHIMSKSDPKPHELTDFAVVENGDLVYPPSENGES
jgi:uncharacterized protein (DUF488 family)